MPWRLSSRNELERELRKVAAAPLQAAVDAAHFPAKVAVV